MWQNKKISRPGIGARCGKAGGGCPGMPGRGVLRLILLFISLLVDGSSIRILIHVGFAIIFPGAALDAPHRNKKNPRPGDRDGDAEVTISRAYSR